MVKCEECHNCYDEEDLKQKTICFEEEFGVSDLFNTRTNTKVDCCPNCGSINLTELEQCDCCEEWFEELNDTEGLVNGNIGYVCDQCLKDSGCYLEEE